MEPKLAKTVKWALDAPGPEGILEIMTAEPGKPQKIEDMAERLNLRPKTIELAITILRRNGFNIRNKRNVGFWLEDGPAPILGGPGTANWKGEPPEA